MKTLSEGMNVTTNNLANCSTIGFKMQNAQYSDLIYQEQANRGDWWGAQENSYVAVGQKGMGVRLDTVRTIYTQGAMQSTNCVTDLAINGSGFFQVKDANGNAYYTRAGDFRTDKEGVVRNPQGMALQGYVIGPDGTKGGLQDVEMDKFDTLKGSGTTKVQLVEMNVNPGGDTTTNAENPWFSLLGLYDATSRGAALPSTSYNYSQGMTLYDSEGRAHEVNVYFDGAPKTALTGSSVEFLVAASDANLSTPAQAGDGLLMSGVLSFDAAGRLTGISAYTPTVAGSKDLSTWSVASLSGDGLPLMTMDGATMGFDCGISASGWSGGGTAADVGADASKLAISSSPTITSAAVTGYKDAASQGSYSQDGYGDGVLTNYSISGNGTVTGRYSNGQSRDMWQIPVCRFRSEDGLRREGSNLFAATPEAGQMDMGVAGTENYGRIESYNIEQSNVDIASEMVDMIITQRGFQSNSKVVTTSDQLLERAINLKRS